MQIAEIDLVGLVAVIMGISIVLIPVIGLTARFALKPTVETLAKFFDVKGDQQVIQLLERRVALLEQHIEHVESSVNRLGETQEFDRQLKGGTPAADDQGV
jgi:hypothetical protein